MVCCADALLSLIPVWCAIIAWPLTKKGAVLANNSENKGRLFLRFAKVTRKSCLDILLFESDGGEKDALLLPLLSLPDPCVRHTTQRVIKTWKCLSLSCTMFSMVHDKLKIPKTRSCFEGTLIHIFIHNHQFCHFCLSKFCFCHIRLGCGLFLRCAKCLLRHLYFTEHLIMPWLISYLKFLYAGLTFSISSDVFRFTLSLLQAKQSHN